MGMINALKSLFKTPITDSVEDKEPEFETHYTMDGKEYRLPVDEEDAGAIL